MDHYASNSSHYFSPDHINVTLYFMCGVHNCTHYVDISNLQKFDMIGRAGRQHVTINMPMPVEPTFSFQDMVTKKFYSFTNVSKVTMENISVHYISISFEGEYFCATCANFYGYSNFTSVHVSIINITGPGSLALFENCIFQQNSFLHFHYAMIDIHDSVFHSYNHVIYPAIRGINSTLNLSGSVHIFNNHVVGAVIFLAYTTDSKDVGTSDRSRSTLNIINGAFVHFINNTAKCGGAIYVRNTAVNVGYKVKMNFFENKARKWHHLHTESKHCSFLGGAVLLDNSSITTATDVRLHFDSNYAGQNGGALCLQHQSEIRLTPQTEVIFASNFAAAHGGAVYMDYSTIFITGSRIYFHTNRAKDRGGGALYIYFGQLSVVMSVLIVVNNSALNYAGGSVFMLNSKLDIIKNSELNFTDNIAHFQGGAIHQALGGGISVASHSVIRFINNSANQGGALYLSESATLNVGNDSIVIFANNLASDHGGAIYANFLFDLPCFLVLKSSSGAVIFQENVAKTGIGMDVYGASIRSSTCDALSKQRKSFSYCRNRTKISITHSNASNRNLSSVSSEPKRVCLCDSNHYPQCAVLPQIFVTGLKIYSGESFNLSLVVVGHDFGVTTGAITANFISQNGHSQPRLHQYQYHQWLGSTQCSNVTYTVFSVNEMENIYLQTTSRIVSKLNSKHVINDLIEIYDSNNNYGCLGPKLLTVPIYVNVSIFRGCPPGFRIDGNNGCTCLQNFKSKREFIGKCYIWNNIGYFEWNSTSWINVKNDTIILSQHCPLSYCLSGIKVVDLASDPDAQCEFNHAGSLCGGCKSHYSLSIGSSRCILCSSNRKVSLFLFFISAGITLVMFILALNLTVAQGLVNGLIFYANILWTYKGILFPSEQGNMITILQVFIAWLNLDFGIETCFVVGLTAFWKTWLQFLFPLYIWFIAGVIIITCRYSSCLTNLIGDRAVPLLATLFLLSYTKLLCTIISILEFGILTSYPEESKIIVWYLDGNLVYCEHPHIYLFVVAIFTLIFCLSFTLFLLLNQCCRRISHLRPLRWINKFFPFYDAYFAPLKDKHHYWFGTLLLVRIALLITFTAASSNTSKLTLLVLQFTLIMLLFYTSIRPVYKSKLVRMLDSTSQLNLIALVGSTLFAGNRRAIFIKTSIALAFIQFIAIVIYSVMMMFYNKRNKYRKNYNCLHHQDEMIHERIEDLETSEENVNNLRSTLTAY
jgi:predicted outer membrane repeat protein